MLHGIERACCTGLNASSEILSVWGANNKAPHTAFQRSRIDW